MAVLPMTVELVHPLTPREIEILRALADGLNLEGTGGRLGITRATVKTHLARIFAKLGVHSQAEAVASAFRAGLLS